MKQNKFTFQSENLTVDWIGLKFQSIFVSSDNKFQVLFVNEGPDWKGTSVHFYGTNAAFFTVLLAGNFFLSQFWVVLI